MTGADNRDYSIEIDPRGADKEMLQLLADLGFNRVSLGVQDFDETVQLAVNRLQPSRVARVHDAARELGFRSINFDLIYGLPKQTLESFGATLDRVAAMRPDRVAVYGYAHMPHVFKAQRQIRSAELPNAAARLALLQLAIDKLGSRRLHLHRHGSFRACPPTASLWRSRTAACTAAFRAIRPMQTVIS